MPLLGASGEQQLQHLPLQEVPQHVRGSEADWPVQVGKQNWTGSKGHSLPSDVCQVLIWELAKKEACRNGSNKRRRCDGNGGEVFHQHCPKNSCDAF